MSQFSRKYYKNDYKLESEEKSNNHNTPFNKGVWTFWRVWGLYEYLVLGLLLVIIFILLLTRDTTVIQQTNVVKKTTHPTTSIEKNKQEKVVEESDFPKKILPSNPLPKKSVVDGENLYGPLTMQEYLYFADDVDNFYPHFFDKKSRKSIASAHTECQNSDCILTPNEISNLYMAAYTEWLNDTTSQKYTFVLKNNHYYLKE
ncbi:hypothetical protein [Sulfurimonas sp. NWX367]|uniref:hypothetical protein n=1 Tax=Sulfurimonas sp. NWX367 TaxID=2925413 RepID=UPI0032048DCC